MSDDLVFLDDESIDRLEAVCNTVEQNFGKDENRGGGYRPTALRWCIAAKTTEEITARSGTTWGKGDCKLIKLDKNGAETDDSETIEAWNAQTDTIESGVRCLLFYNGEIYIIAPLVCGADD